MRTNMRKKAPESNRRRHRKFTLAATVILLSTVVAQLGAATAFAADPPTGAPTMTDDSVTQAFINDVGPTVIDNQDALSTYRSWMIEQDGFADSGYVGSIDDLQNKATVILWAGPRTALLKAILAEGRRRGITVTVRKRSNSLEQIDTAVDAIWQQAAAGDWAGFHISTIEAVGATDNGLVVNGTYTSIPASDRAAQVQSLATVVDGIPVRVVPGVGAFSDVGTSTAGTAAPDVEGDRAHDFAPFAGGDYMISPTGRHTCSNGFGILVSGHTRVTTARHCVANDYKDRFAPNKYGTGVVRSGDGGGRVLSAKAVPVVQVGPIDDVNFRRVQGFEDLAINDFVCTDGGNSGEHCKIKVTNLLVSFNDGFGTFHTIKGVQQNSGEIASIEGDSGGPVLSLANVSPGGIRAAGMIQGGEDPHMTNCGLVFDAGRCSKIVLFSSMRTVVNTIHDASLLTNG